MSYIPPQKNNGKIMSVTCNVLKRFSEQLVVSVPFFLPTPSGSTDILKTNRSKHKAPLTTVVCREEKLPHSDVWLDTYS